MDCQDKLIKANSLLKQYGIFDKLSDFDPILVGTIPINIDIERSDLDIICYYQGEPDFFLNHLTETFSYYDHFRIINNKTPVVVSFFIEEFEIEIYGDTIPTKVQNAYRHMLIEKALIDKYGEEFRLKIIDLKRNGLKTEPAFAKLLGIEGDPYEELLKLIP